MLTLINSARDYYDVGWVTTPLRKDPNGYPKIPIERGWQQTPYNWASIKAQRWHHADGIGIVLGPASHNLACVDLDDAEAAGLCFLYGPLRESTRMVKTARNRGHIYVQEKEPTLSSTSFKASFQGREIQVELKAKGTQVAAVPSPGYELIGVEQPWVLDSIETCWRILADHYLMIENERRTQTGYPRPWKDEVGEGERNRSAYVEAHQLREAGVPLVSALEIMRIRVEKSYIQAHDMSWDEIERTIRSAYTKGEVTSHKGGVDLTIE